MFVLFTKLQAHVELSPCRISAVDKLLICSGPLVAEITKAAASHCLTLGEQYSVCPPDAQVTGPLCKAHSNTQEGSGVSEPEHKVVLWKGQMHRFKEGRPALFGTQDQVSNLVPFT